MPTTINYGSEIIRINIEKKRLEYSTNGGRTWSSRCTSSIAGDFIDLLAYGNELLAVTSKGVYYSTNGGRTWSSRYMPSVVNMGEFYSLQNNGKELLATTSKGLYYSTNNGRTWSKRS